MHRDVVVGESQETGLEGKQTSLSALDPHSSQTQKSYLLHGSNTLLFSLSQPRYPSHKTARISESGSGWLPQYITLGEF